MYIGNVGIAITQSIGLVGILQFGIRQITDLEIQMTSVERILEYTNVPQEGSLESLPGNIMYLSKQLFSTYTVSIGYWRSK